MSNELRAIALELSKLADRLLFIVDGEQPQQDRLQQFFDEGNAFAVKGRSVRFSEFYSAFKAWLAEHERSQWTKARVKQELRFDTFSEGRADQPTLMIDGVSFKPAAIERAPEPEPEPELPTNPDYDSYDTYCTIKPLKQAGLSYEEIATRLNDQGLRDENGQKWTAITAQRDSYD